MIPLAAVEVRTTQRSADGENLRCCLRAGKPWFLMPA